MHFNDRDEIIALTPMWKGERLPDGRPKVDEKYLKALRTLTLEEVWKPIFVKGYESQFEGRLQTLHTDGRKLIGRAVTATYCPFRPDLDAYTKDKGREEGRTGTYNQWVIDNLMEYDVPVIDMYDKIYKGTFLGGNLTTALKNKTKNENGGAVIWGGYRVTTDSGEVLSIDNPAKLPPTQSIRLFEEPILTCHVHVPDEYVGNVLKLCQERRGVQKDIRYFGTSRVQISYELPLAEVVFDFFDKLKSVSRGYASLDYELKGYEAADLVKLDILLNGDPVDALNVIVHRSRAFDRGRVVCNKLKEVIPRQMYEVAIQAAIGSKVIARTTVKAFRKNVIAKCYGGDISRKRKLLEKQKEGKKRMKQVGAIEIPQEAFLAVLKADEG